MWTRCNAAALGVLPTANKMPRLVSIVKQLAVRAAHLLGLVEVRLAFGRPRVLDAGPAPGVTAVHQFRGGVEHLLGLSEPGCHKFMNL